MTIEELRVLITAKTESLQDGINRATSRLREFKKTSDEADSTMGGNVKSMERKLESLNSSFQKTQAKIMETTKKIEELKAKQSEKMDFYKEFPAFTGMSKEDSLKQLFKSDPGIQKLQVEIDKLQAKMQPFVDKNKQAKEEMNGLAQAIKRVSSETNEANSHIKKTTNSTSKLGRKISEVGDRAKRSTGKVVGFANMINRSFMRVLRRIFIYNLIYKMIRGLIGYMGGALKTNNQFVRSLNTIKTNLRVAFQPIYEFILPAINALMRALATLSTYIASFVSSMFGKTYQQSYNAAKGIETAKKAMDGYGSSAKKAKGQLAGFDEINTLGKEDGSSGGGADGFEMETPDLSVVDTSLIDNLRNRLAELFNPFKDAWENEGLKTVESFKRAFGSMKTLINEIGKSFKEVWIGGSGQEILEKLLRILQHIFNLVGAVVDSFRNAWTKNNTGTEIIQGLANALSTVLGIIESIGESLNKVWGEIGESVAKTFMSILESTVGILNSLAEGLRSVWDNGGQHLFESLIKLGAKVFELAGYIYTEFVAPFIDWFIELVAPAIGKVMDKVADLLDRFTDLIDWLLGDGKPVLDTIITILGSLAIAFGVVKGALIAKTTALTIGQGALALFKGAIGALLSPIGLVVLAVGGIIAVLIHLWKTNEEFRDNVKKVWEQVKELYKVSTEFIKKVVGAAFDWLNGIWDKHGEKVKGITKVIWDTVGNIVNSKLKAIQGFLDVFIGLFTEDWSRMGNGIENTWKGMWGVVQAQVKGAWGLMSPAFSSLKNSITSWFTGLISDARNWGRNLISNFTDGISSMVNKVRDASKNVANTVKDYLGFASPTKEGPGAQADRWMPNLMNMLADGIEDNIFKVRGAVNVTAESLREIEPTNDTGSIVSQIAGIIGGMSTDGGDIHLTVKLGEDTITEKVISNINRQNRISGKTVITV